MTMLRVPLLVASAVLLFVASCGGPADGGVLPSASGPSSPEGQEPAAAASPQTATPAQAGVAATATALPTFTPLPTVTGTGVPPPTSTPTETAIHTPTSTAAVTITVEPPGPTATPTATSTASPSPTPPPPLPTATATPTDGLEPTIAPTPTITPTRTPVPSAVFIRSHTSYALDSQLVVVGELLNGADYDAFNVRVHGRFFNREGSLIGTAEVPAAFPKLEVERLSPFRMIVDIDPAETNSYELTVSFEDFSIVEYREPEVSAVALVERDGRLLVVGSLHNGHENALSSVVVAVTFYDEGGGVVDVVESFLGDEAISPGSGISFEIPLHGTGRMFSRMLVLAQGRLSMI